MMYRIDRNNFHLKPKSSNVYTPSPLSEYLFSLLSPLFPDKSKIIFDPCCGTGNLLRPWKKNGYRTFGIDIDKSLGDNGYVYMFADFLQLDKPLENRFDFKNMMGEFAKPQLILCNPPFNGYYPKLAGEVWLDKIIEIFGKNVPLVIFSPYGFRLGLGQSSKRAKKFQQGNYPSISSIISLPLDIYEGKKFHSEILIFNIPGLKSHYFYHHAN